jgi:hypothetical protein
MKFVAVKVVIFLLGLVISSNGLSCWVCNSNNDPGCTIEYNDFQGKENRWIKKTECSEVDVLKKNGLAGRASDATACFKFVALEQGQTTVIRSCASAGDKIIGYENSGKFLEEVDKNGCSSTSNSINGVTTAYKTCTCTSNNCNGNGVGDIDPSTLPKYKCWECNSEREADCADSSNLKEGGGIVKSDCKTMRLEVFGVRNNVVRTNRATGCYKAKVTSNGKTRVARTCIGPGDVVIGLKEFKPGCVTSTQKGKDGVEAEIEECFCDGDYCNGADTFKIGDTLFMLMPIAALVAHKRLNV